MTTMATKAASAAGKAAEPLTRNFPIGGKQIYLPNHVITFIRPRKMQQPNLATFLVPLQFNKLDLRDYLFHVYNVRVNAVRSFINAATPVRKGSHRSGHLHRPRPIKYMIAELESPFVWPDPPAETDREDFSYTEWKLIQDQREANHKIWNTSLDGELELPSKTKESSERQKLADMAQAYLSGKEVWKNNTSLDEIWDPVVQEMQAQKLRNYSRVLGDKQKDGSPSKVETGTADDK